MADDTDKLAIAKPAWVYMPAPRSSRNRVSVVLRVGGVHINGVHERTADKGETAACEVPRHVVTVSRHEGAVEHNGKNKDADEREETYPCLDSGVVPRKLKEEWDKVHWYEEHGCRGGRRMSE